MPQHKGPYRGSAGVRDNVSLLAGARVGYCEGCQELGQIGVGSSSSFEQFITHQWMAAW